MWCNICGKSFNRGTTTTLSNNYCDDCHDKYITYTVIKRNTKEEIEYYNSVIQSFEEENEELKERIKKNEQTIKCLKEQIGLVLK
jgi:predicted RNase H-like nuclease (RuvC/YqgF family)